MKKKYIGPVFIIGMPRSGTKLLRAILNRHSKVSITVAESHFIPYLVDKFGITQPFDNKDQLNKYFKELKKSPLNWWAEKSGYKFNKNKFRDCVDNVSWGSIFRCTFMQFSPNKSSNKIIWGDKSPGYINHIGLLEKIFDNPKFIHIVRDPRDYCLSVKNAWGGSFIRAANSWNKTIYNLIDKKYDKTKNNFITIRYEDLLTNPKNTIEKVCEFISVGYESRMLTFNKSPEYVGDARGYKKIKSDNMNKFPDSLDKIQIKSIEEIVFNTMSYYGYSPEFGESQNRVNKLHLVLLKLIDGISSVSYHIKNKGFIDGLWLFANHHIKSSWNN